VKALKDDLRIETALPDDLPRVLDLWYELMELTAEYNRHYHLVSNARHLQESYFKAFFESSSATIFLARERREIVGFTNVYVTRPAAVFVQNSLGIIENLYVLPAYRRRRIGGLLVAGAHEYFTDFDTDEIYVNVIPANETSEKFWAAMGYKTQKLTMAFEGATPPLIKKSSR
jgi:diamine N-acetyltransferase